MYSPPLQWPFQICVRLVGGHFLLSAAGPSKRLECGRAQRFRCPDVFVLVPLRHFEPPSGKYLPGESGLPASGAVSRPPRTTRSES